MVTPANNALFVINGKARTVNCEIGGVLHPIAVVWTVNKHENNILNTNPTTNNTSASDNIQIEKKH